MPYLQKYTVLGIFYPIYLRISKRIAIFVADLHKGKIKKGEKSMKMKEVKKSLKGKVMFEMKMEGVSVMKFMKKGGVVYYEVLNEWKRKDGVRILKGMLEEENGGEYASLPSYSSVA